MTCTVIISQFHITLKCNIIQKATCSLAEKGGRGKDPVQHSHDFFVISSCKVSGKFKERLDIAKSKGENYVFD